MIDGWNTACKAFPSGNPKEFVFDINPMDLAECANGYKYEKGDPDAD
jgi:hypothetical protein